MLGSPRRSKHLHGVLNFLLQVVVVVFEFAGKVEVVPSETECGQIYAKRCSIGFNVHSTHTEISSRWNLLSLARYPALSFFVCAFQGPFGKSGDMI